MNGKRCECGNHYAHCALPGAEWPPKCPDCMTAADVKEWLRQLEERGKPARA